MIDERVLREIRDAGDVPPAPDRDAAFMRAMSAAMAPSRTRMRRTVVLAVAAAILALPASVFAARGVIVPILTKPFKIEQPDVKSRPSPGRRSSQQRSTRVEPKEVVAPTVAPSVGSVIAPPSASAQPEPETSPSEQPPVNEEPTTDPSPEPSTSPDPVGPRDPDPSPTPDPEPSGPSPSPDPEPTPREPDPSPSPSASPIAGD